MTDSTVKTRILLLLGIALPALLVIFIWAFRESHQTLIPPPQFNFIYTINNYGPNKIVVENNAVYLIRQNKEQTQFNKPELYLYDVTAQKSQALSYSEPENSAQLESKTEIYKFEQLQIQTQPTSPDGFVFEHVYHRSLLFGAFNSGAKQGYFLSKEGKRFELELYHQYQSVQFLGWLIRERVNE